MNDRRKQQRSFSKRKSSYAPIMLTSKAVKPLQREDQSEHLKGQKCESSQQFRSKLTRFMKESQAKYKNKQLIEAHTCEIGQLNETQKNFNKLKNEEIDRTFSYSSKKARILNGCESQISLNDKQFFDEIYYKRSKDPNRQLNPFFMKQPAPSAVINVEFNQRHARQKATRKNNFNNNRYNVIFSYGNSAPHINRPHKSIPNNSRQMFNDREETAIDGTEDRKIKIVSPSQKNDLNIPINKPLETYFWLQDPSRKLMLTQKQKPFELTFTNFKKKVNERKMSKTSKHKSKYSEEWSEYLNRYYLNVKKIKPLLKFQKEVQKDAQQISRSEREAKSSAQMHVNQTSKGSRIADNNQKTIKINSIEEGENNIFQPDTMKRARSNTIMMSSKTDSVLQNSDINPPLSPQKSHKIRNNDLSKIQLDIITKRISTNKKDYFVFSMGEVSNQNKNENPNVLKFNLYKDYLWKVNFSNNIYVRLPDEIQKPYKFFVGKGNNSGIIKGIMKRRFWWQLSEKISPDVNFVWTQLKVNDFVKSQKQRKHEQLKLLLDSNHHSHDFSNQNQRQLLSQVFKDTYQLNNKVFRGNDLSLWLSHFKRNSKHQQKYFQDSSMNILQKRFKSMVTRKRITFIDSSSTFQQKSHNHFECNYFIGNKKALFYAMRKYYKLYGQDPFDFIPLTFHISGGLEDPQFNEFLERYNTLNQERLKNKNSDIRNIWIVKPGQVTNCGRGISVCATLDEIKIRLKSKEKNSDGSLRTYILQKYIEKPLLYQKRKFDIRHYMLMTCINGCIKGYWYQEGYIRTTSTEYNIKNCKDLYTHLTNDAIQKNSSDYGKYEKGNKISYEQFQKYLVKTYRKDFDFFEEILPKMKRLATDSMRATYSIIEPNRIQNNFQLFGLDFMLDQNMKVYLIQCNTNPCLELSCPLLSKIISGLVENVFKICIDPIFPPPFEWPNSKKFQMGDHALNDMKFQIVFDQTYDGRQLQKLYGAEKGLGNKIGKVEQEEEEYQDDGGQQEWDEESNS